MALADGIEALFTTWASRNVQASKATTTERDEAIAAAVAELEHVFGEAPDENDTIACNIGFVEAIIWLRAMISLEVSTDMERFIDKWQEKKQRIIDSRKAQESVPRKVRFNTTRIAGLFPFGSLPWEV